VILGVDVLIIIHAFRSEYNLPVPVPLETASNMEEVRLYNEQKKAAMATGQPLYVFSFHKLQTKCFKLFLFTLLLCRKSDDVVRPKVTLQSCLEALVRPEEVQNFYSTAISGKTTALKYVFQYLKFE
jgi:ubiquitin carboxyl-terminal hydrolase 5/13